jgi:hypothetical protein
MGHISEQDVGGFVSHAMPKFRSLLLREAAR